MLTTSETTPDSYAHIDQVIIHFTQLKCLVWTDAEAITLPYLSYIPFPTTMTAMVLGSEQLRLMVKQRHSSTGILSALPLNDLTLCLSGSYSDTSHLDLLTRATSSVNPCLKTLTIDLPTSLHEELLFSLSSFHSLECLEMWFSHRGQQKLAPGNNERISFPRLKRLFLQSRTSATRWNVLLKRVELPTVENIVLLDTEENDLESFIEDTDSTKTFDILPTMASREMLRSFVLRQHYDPLLHECHYENSLAFTGYRNLRPLGLLKNLQVLRLHLHIPIAMTEEEIDLLTRCWPQLLILDLLPPEPDAHKLPLNAPCGTAALILVIAKNCPKLKELAIAMKAGGIPPRPDGKHLATALLSIRLSVYFDTAPYDEAETRSFIQLIAPNMYFMKMEHVADSC